MKGNRTSIIAVVGTLVLVFCLMASGLPQRMLTAISLNDEKYSVAEFHLYYYDAYYDFLIEHNGEDLTEMGLLSNSRLHRQESPYGMSWYDYFKGIAEDEMLERYILNEQASLAGYTLSASGEAAVQEEHDIILQLTSQSGLTEEKDYLQRLYQPGTTVDSYYYEFERGVLADEYKEKLISESFMPSNDAVEQRASELVAEESSNEAYTANVAVIEMHAKADRFSETIEERQLENLEIRGNHLYDDFMNTDQSLDTFETYIEEFSEEADLELTAGIHEGVRTEDYPTAVSSWYASKDRKAGDVTLINEGETAYLIYYIAQGEKECVIDARNALIDEAYGTWLEEQKSNVTLKEHFFGLRVAR